MKFYIFFRFYLKEYIYFNIYKYLYLISKYKINSFFFK